MRSVALALVLSLVSPAVMTAVCELGCLRAEHHDAGAAAAADCHGHGAGPVPAMAWSSAHQAPCHDAAAAPSAIVVASQQPVSMPAVIHVPQDAAFGPSTTSSLSAGFRAARPLLLITTQLRT